MNNQKKIFITGTDTDVGKTLVTVALIEKLQQQGLTVVALKPVAAGCEIIKDTLVNADALQIQERLRVSLAYSTINPFPLTEPIAPHLAAESENEELTVERLRQKCNLSLHQTEYLLVEGAGGWLVPLNRHETMADYAAVEGFDVLLVVGMKLGCINHALLTVQSIKRSGLNLVGWVANSSAGTMPKLTENITTLKQAIDAPLIAEIPYLQDTLDLKPKPSDKSRSLANQSAYNKDNLVKLASSYVKLSAL
jgi:dethiobiotin synthetase